MDDSAADNARREGLLIVISGPSGVGKTTIARAVIERFHGAFSVSATTRPRSNQETDGVDYCFLTEDRFKAMIEADEFLEHAVVFERYHYGTPRRPVEEALASGRLVLLDIDVQGAIQVRRRAPEAFLLFVLPPSEADLLARLRGRGRDDDEAIQRRLDEAQKEIAFARSSGAYDAFIVNDDLQRAQNEACQLVRERLTHKAPRI